MSALKLKIEEKAMRISYTEEEIKKLENQLLHREKSIDLESNYIKDEYTQRIETYNKMLSIVQSQLCTDEKITLSKINIPHKSGSGGMSSVLYYQGLFFTNKRIFIFNMNFKYEEIEPMKALNISDISILRHIEDLDIVRIEFNNSDRLSVKSYFKDESELTLLIVKYLLEEGVKFSNKNKLMENLFN